jgi:hypothetical protein
MSNTKEIVGIACKLLGLLFLVSGISTFPMLAQGIVTLTQEGQKQVGIPLGYLFVPIIQFAAAGIFLIYSEAIATRVIKAEPEDEPLLDGPWQKGFYEICIRLIGIYVVTQAVPNVVNQLIYIISLSQSQPNIPIHFWTTGIGHVVSLVIGIHLLAGGQLFTRLAKLLRERFPPTVSEPE